MSSATRSLLLIATGSIAAFIILKRAKGREARLCLGAPGLIVGVAVPKKAEHVLLQVPMKAVSSSPEKTILALQNDVSEPDHAESGGSLEETGQEDDLAMLGNEPPRRSNLALWLAVAGIVLTLAAGVFFGLRLHRLETLVANDSAARLDEQRAWVGLAEAKPLPLTAEGGGFEIRLQNTGKTPAFDVKVANVCRFVAANEPLAPPAADSAISAGNLIPSASYLTDVWFSPPSGNADAFQSGDLRAVDLVLVSYKDIFQQQHTSKICFYWYGRLSNVRACDAYNELN